MAAKLIKYLAVFAFFVLAIWVLILGVANLFANHAIEHETQWGTANTVKDKESWDSAHASLRVAMALDPYNPDYPEIMGRLYIWRYSIQDAPITSEEEANLIFEQGSQYIQLSINKRPAWFDVYNTQEELEEVLEDTIQQINLNK